LIAPRCIRRPIQSSFSMNTRTPAPLSQPQERAHVQLPAQLIARTCPRRNRVPGHLFIPRSQLENESPWSLSRCPCGRPGLLRRQPKDMPGTAPRATDAGLDAARAPQLMEIATPASLPYSHCGPSVADANTTSVLRDCRLSPRTPPGSLGGRVVLSGPPHEKGSVRMGLGGRCGALRCYPQ
jgi:hypothetical protein